MRVMSLSDSGAPTLAGIKRLLDQSGGDPRAVVAQVIDGLRRADDDAIWINRRTDEALERRAGQLADWPVASRGPLFAVPFAVQDNIDVSGLPTTAACPAFSVTPARDASVVKRLIEAGAIVVGKTNLDQFATGLVGVRSPFGIPRNPFDGARIPGGAASGAAVAVARGLVSFAIASDAGGEARVPAAFNNIVGFRPSRALVPVTGMVPSFRSCDALAVLALGVGDAWTVLNAIAGPDDEDSEATAAKPGAAWGPARFRFAVPRPEDLKFFGDAGAAAAFADAVRRLVGIGGTPIAIDFAPLREAGELFAGALQVEQRHALRAFMRAHAVDMHPVTRTTIEAADKWTALDLVEAERERARLVAASASIFARADLLLVPTAPTLPEIDAVLADPITLNTRLGAYVGFAGPLGLAALAVPQGLADGLPHGVSLVAPAGGEALLTGIGDRLQRAAGARLGALDDDRLAPFSIAIHPPGTTALAVFGAEMSDLSRNRELTRLGARFGGAIKTAALYRALLAAGEPTRVGLLRAKGGAAIAGEIWMVPDAGLAALVKAVRAPLGLGEVRLDDGRKVLGFLIEAKAAADGDDISGHGGYRAWLARRDAE